MRIQPPKTRNKYFTYDEFKDYALNHKVVGDGESYSVIELWKDMLTHHSKEEAIEKFITLWPLEYQNTIYQIFLEI